MSVDAGKTMAEGKGRPAAAGWSRSFGPLNPLRAVWWLVTNVRFAIVLLAALSLVSLLGVVLPQVPLNVRGDSVAEAAWLRVQEGRFGPLTDPIDRLGLFDVFHTSWFAVLMALTVAATGAYIFSRFSGIWQTITKPRRRVPERYFEMAPNRVDVPSAVDVSRLEELLRRRRYRVERSSEEGATYLFADRFQWAALGTLLTHAAVIVFILSAVVSRVDAFSSPLFLAEGATLPVFPVKDPDQMQVQLADARAAFAADGQPLDYRSELIIYQRGEEVLRCESTVNSPCSYNGYRFYQAAYFGYGAALQVRDLDTGNVVYKETLALSDKRPAPRVTVRDAQGQTVLDDSLVLADTATAEGVTYSAALVRLPDGRPLTFWLPQSAAGSDEKMLVFEPGSGADVVRLSLGPGETGKSGGLEVSYVEREMAPALLVADFPLPRAVGEGDSGAALLQLSNVVYGTGTTSGGTNLPPASSSGPPRLTVVGLQPQPVTLQPGQKATIDNYEYTFLGQREFAGIDVKRDRSDYLVWTGAALIVLGLMITFWVPRRRLWARITATRTSLAGQAASHANYTRELRRLAAEAGAAIPEGTEDDD